MIKFEVDIFNMPCIISIDKVVQETRDDMPVWVLHGFKIHNQYKTDIKFKHIPRSCPDRNFYGTYFLADMGGNQFYHTTLEKFGQFLWLKKHFNDLEFLPMSGHAKNLFQLAADNQAIEAMRLGSTITNLNLWNMIYLYFHSNIYIEKVVVSVGYSFSPFKEIPRFFVASSRLTPYVTEDQLKRYVPITPLFFKALSEKAQSVDFGPTPLPDAKKIFISRNLTSKMMEPFYKILNKIEDNTATRQDYLDFYKGSNKKSPNNIHFFWVNLLIRYYPIKESLQIENYFKGLGYTIINAEDYTTTQQAAIFREATHIAAWRGTSCTNFYASPKSTKKIIINNTHLYNHPYPEIVSGVEDNNVAEFPGLLWNTEGIDEHRFSAHEIIEASKEFKSIL